MKETKNDLSFNSTTLDWGALEDSVSIAYRLLLNQIHTDSTKLENAMEYEGCADYMTAGKLVNSTKDLVIVAETLHTVQGARTRKGLEIVNKVRESASEMDAEADLCNGVVCEPTEKENQ